MEQDTKTKRRKETKHQNKPLIHVIVGPT